MNKTHLDKQVVVGVLSLILVGGMIFVSVWMNRSNAASSGASLPTSQVASATPVIDESKAQFRGILSDILERIQKQAEVDANLLAELHSGAYSMDAPLIVVDPYDQSPLSALVLFSTKEPTNISVHVLGEDSLTNVDFSFDGYQTDHIIPVYGLYPDQVNSVELTATNEAANTSKATIDIKTGVMPEELNNIIRIVDLAQPEKYQPGFNFTFSNNKQYSKTAFDANGKTRWYLSTKYHSSQLTYDGHFIFSLGEEGSGDVLFLEMNPLGRIYRIFYAPYGNHHDMARFNKNILVAGSNGETIEDFIYEIDPFTGEIVNSLDFRTILQRSRNTGFIPVDDPDWMHMNAITQVEGTNDIIISSRTQSAVVRLSWPEGKIKWILGNHENWLPMFQKYLLSSEGDGFEWQYNQHDPVILPDQDNDPNTMDILMFDNGNQRYSGDLEIQRQIDAHEIVAPEVFSRLVQFRIDEKKMTVTQIREFGKEYGTTLFSPARGSADQLPNGNILGSFDVQPPNSDVAGGADLKNSVNLFEVDSDNQIVWEALEVTKKADGRIFEYRIDRRLIYSFSDNDLQIGTPAANLIPENVYAKYKVAP